MDVTFRVHILSGVFFSFFFPETVQSCLSASQRQMGMAAGVPKRCTEGDGLQALARVARIWSAKELLDMS